MEPPSFSTSFEFDSNSLTPKPSFLLIYPDNNAMTFGLAVSEHAHPSGHPPSSEAPLMLEPPCVEKQNTLQGADSAEIISKIDIRRRAQNRASQRAFRERKEKRIKTLEAQLSSLEEEHSKLLHCHHEQRRMLDRMKAHVRELTDEIEVLRYSKTGDQVTHYTTFDLVPSAQAGDGTGGNNDRDTSFAKPHT